MLYAGCRRLTPGDGYLEALVQPNVTRVFNEIDRITSEGLITDDGTLHEVDVIICATGFNVGFTPSFKLQGLESRVIQREWEKEPRCYLGLSAPHFPNYFTILGPRGPWGNGPLLPSVRIHSLYALSCRNYPNSLHRLRHSANTLFKPCARCSESRSSL